MQKRSAAGRRYIARASAAAGVGLGLLGGAGCKKGDAPATNELVAEAKRLTQGYQQALKSELTDALGSGGPQAAIEVCKLEAPKIAARVLDAERPGWSIGRTALRVRNPNNAPSDWQRRGLEAFQERLAQNADPNELNWHAADGATFRYMRPIMMGGLCVVCHGETEGLQPEVKQRLSQLYPDDQATGFSVGELRGAFVVTATSK